MPRAGMSRVLASQVQLRWFAAHQDHAGAYINRQDWRMSFIGRCAGVLHTRFVEQ
jgi:hypothetical protein